MKISISTEFSSSKLWSLYSGCHIVLGHTRSIVCDLHRNQTFFIPNSLASIIVEEQRTSTIKEIIEKHGHKETIEDYFSFLLENEIIFFTNDLDQFPNNTNAWLSPYQVSNSILDIKDDISWINEAIDQLHNLMCPHIQFRFFSEVSEQDIINVLEKTNSTNIRTIDFIFPYSSWSEKPIIKKLCRKYKRISQFIIYDSKVEDFENEYDHVPLPSMGIIIYTKQKLDSQLHCGKIGKSLFIVKSNAFSEALHHNSCLNRKISIDVEGNIKNCPSMPQSFGNIKNTSLEEALNHTDFKKFWNVNKDQVTVCKDCEFRYICTDCRAYIENPNDAYSKPLKCGYDPYTGQWEEWSTNPLKQKAIEHYGLEKIK